MDVADSNRRLSTGIARLDDLLGGGLLPGTLAAVVGSTGIGKTQLGLQFAHAGAAQEGSPGIVFDMSSRGDSQHHAEYAWRMFNWRLDAAAPADRLSLDGFFDSDRRCGDYLHIFDQTGRRVSRRDLDFDGWQDWQAELTRRLAASIAFFYGNFVRGVRRAVIDGIEPVDRPSDSIQIELFEYIYHQILRKDPEWVARDLFREHYRANAEAIARHVYAPGRDRLHAAVDLPRDDARWAHRTLARRGRRPLQRQHGDLHGQNPRRHPLPPGMYVAKHRGSVCPDEILPYRIEEGGLLLEG